jgi:hypothetical protein
MSMSVRGMVLSIMLAPADRAVRMSVSPPGMVMLEQSLKDCLR